MMKASLDRTEFQPSETQRRLLSVFQDADYQISTVAACTAAEVGRQTFYDWTHGEDFNRWWLEQAERWAALSLPRVLGNLTAGAQGTYSGKAAKPDHNLVKLYLERFDKSFLPATRQRVDVFDHGDQTEEELLARAQASRIDEDDLTPPGEQVAPTSGQSKK